LLSIGTFTAQISENLHLKWAQRRPRAGMTPPILRFSTRDVPHCDGLDYWSGIVCEKYLELDSVSLETTGRFWSDLELARFGLLRVFHSCGSPQVVERRRHAANKCVVGNYVLVTSLDGPWMLDTPTGQFQMATSDLALLDSAKPFVAHFPNRMNNHIFELPRAWMHSWISEAEVQHSPRIDGAMGWGRALRGISEALSPEFATSSAVSNELLVSHFGTTLALAKRSPLSKEKVSKGGLASLVEGVMRQVDERYSEADLTARMIAAELHVSERTLYRALERNGYTFFGLLAHKRMAEARRMLSDHHKLNALSLAEIGRRVGYPHASQFSRAFSKLQSMTPREYRRNEQKLKRDMPPLVKQ
jgi:AraC family transcriptional regulator, positive regulator of tynA and feaB